MEPRKQAILDALTRFMNQRSGIEFGNYGDVKAFRAEQRSITKDLHQARTLLMAVARTDGIDADALIKAAEGAFSGRLTITLNDMDGVANQPLIAEIDYCTGQYFPTEYRRAVCAVLASALWEYTREHCMPPWGLKDGDYVYPPDDRKPWPISAHVSGGDWLRAHFRKEFGRGIAARWFS